jgi:hypothetical protein
VILLAASDVAWNVGGRTRRSPSRPSRAHVAGFGLGLASGCTLDVVVAGVGSAAPIDVVRAIARRRYHGRGRGRGSDGFEPERRATAELADATALVAGDESPWS